MPFMQVSLIRGLRIDDPTYIYLPIPPSRVVHAFDPKSLRARNPNPYIRDREIE
jgi:hypothetical protein